MSLELFEGYLALLISEDVRVTIGRFAMSFGDEKVIGLANWVPSGRSFDGVRLRIGADEARRCARATIWGSTVFCVTA